ncbi:MAG: aldo/keto reductase [Treponema sp.]|jgi:predicted aldo/keto reductase-like oxidoreductase|nr:aldo/keto reductase [Treponema sp.]
MQYRLDVKTGNKLSVLGFGCMRFPKNLGKIDMRKTEDMVLRAIETGVNYFDTAWVYGGSEEVLGTILEKNKLREKVYIATKLPVVYLKGREDFDKYFNQTLERLRTDYIDYYLMHMLTDMDLWEKLKKWGIVEWIAEKKRQGKIRQIGFSYHGNLNEFLKIIDDYPWELCQIQYNYSDENFQAGVTGLRKAAEKMPVIIMEPLLGGKLANGLPKAAVEIFKEAKPELTPAGWGLNWVWNQKEAAVVLSGMSDIVQLEENLRLAEDAKPEMLSGADRETYRKVLDVFNASYKIHCTGCNYCMPCPKGVNISGCFAAYNTSYSMGFMVGMQQFATSTALTSDKWSSPGLCVKCGKCEGHCPQHLPIIKNLGLVRRRLEPFWFRAVEGIVRALLGRKKVRKEA